MHFECEPASGSCVLSKLHFSHPRLLLLLSDALDGLPIPAFQQAVLGLNTVAGGQKCLTVGVKIDMRSNQLDILFRQ